MGWDFHLSLFVDQPRVSGRVIPERSLSSPCWEKNTTLGSGLCLSLCRNPHDAVWVLCGVSATALQTQTVPGTLVHSPHALTRFLDRWVSRLPLGSAGFRKHPTRAKYFLKPPFSQTLLSPTYCLSYVRRAPHHFLARLPHSGF